MDVEAWLSAAAVLDRVRSVLVCCVDRIDFDIGFLRIELDRIKSDCFQIANDRTTDFKSFPTGSIGFDVVPRFRNQNLHVAVIGTVFGGFIQNRGSLLDHNLSQSQTKQ